MPTNENKPINEPITSVGEKRMRILRFTMNNPHFVI